jgi:hypothetical protein
MSIQQEFGGTLSFSSNWCDVPYFEHAVRLLFLLIYKRSEWPILLFKVRLMNFNYSDSKEMRLMNFNYSDSKEMMGRLNG